MTVKRFIAVLAVAAVAAVPTTASAGSNDQAPLIHGVPNNCAVGGVGVSDGHVVAHRNDKTGEVKLNIVIRNGLPNTTYNVSITCVQTIGTLTTNSQGTGTGQFKVPSAPPAFRVNLSPTEGPGDDFFTPELLVP